MPKSKSYEIILNCSKALWSRPESKQHRDRSSYDVPTVSALKEIIGKIYKKPCLSIVIESFGVLSFHGRASATMYKIEPGNRYNHILSGETFLMSPRYYVKFHYEPNFNFELPENWGGNTEDYVNINNSNFSKFFSKHEAIFERRISRGEVFDIPYSGVKNSGSVDIQLINNLEEPLITNVVLEPMFLSMVFGNESTYPKNDHRNISNFLKRYQVAKVVWPDAQFENGLLFPPKPEDLFRQQYSEYGNSAHITMRNNDAS